MVSETHRSDSEKICLKEQWIIDCAILAKDYIGFITIREGNYDPWEVWPPVSFVTFDLEKDKRLEGPWGCSEFKKNNFLWPKSVHIAPEEMLVVDSEKTVYYNGLGDRKYREVDIPEDAISRSIYGLKNIKGTIYAVGQPRAVARRDGPSQWTLISQEAQEGVEQLDALKIGFDCIDGFDQNDLYAGGGHSDLWHYDGSHWTALDLPITDMRIRAISCADDGQVYLVGRFGDIVRGRDDHWELLEHGETEEDFTDAVWYQDRLYVAGSYLYELKGNELKRVDFGDVEEAPFSFGHLYANAGLLLSAGPHSAALYDGEKWKPLYGCIAVKETQDLAVATKLLLDAEEMLGELGEVTDNLRDKNKSPKP